MKLVRKTSVKLTKSKSGKEYKRQMGIFICPKCSEEVERIVSNGEKALTCGSKACKDSHPESGAKTQREPIYTAWVYMKQMCKESRISYPEEWNDYLTFFTDIGFKRTVSSRLTRYDIDEGYSVENCYWKVQSSFVSGISHTNQKTALGRSFEQHGMHATRPYRIWQNMKNRCYYKGHKSYKNYGAKGVVVCPEWKDSFHTFWEDMKDGYSDEMTIDRIDSSKSYYKENCRWLTLADNSGRSRAKLTLQLDKETGSIIKEWPSARQAALELSIDASSITKVIKGKKKSAGGFCWKAA